jgi:hypothetical protein
MRSLFMMAIGLALAGGMLSAQEAAQPPALGYKDSYQLDYLDILGNINLTNGGAHANLQSPPASSDICVHAYVFQPITGSPDGPLGATLASCCSCRVPANAVKTIPLVLSGPVVVKLVSTLPSRLATPCDPTVAPLPGLGTPGGYAAGMRAWSVSQPTVLSPQLSTSKFDKAPLGDAEQAKLSQLCSASTTKCTCQ